MLGAVEEIESYLLSLQRRLPRLPLDALASPESDWSRLKRMLGCLRKKSQQGTVLSLDLGQIFNTLASTTKATYLEGGTTWRACLRDTEK